MAPGYLGKDPDLCCPLFSFVVFWFEIGDMGMNYIRENEMLPIVAAVERLESSAAQAGLSSEDLIDLLQGDMDLEHLMSYVTAVLTKRLN